MKNTIKIFAAAMMIVATSFVSEKASAKYRTENAVSSFYNINVKDNIDVEIRQGETQGLVIESSEPASELVKTEIKDGTLYIFSAENRSSGEKAKVIVTTPEIQAIVMDGSGNVTSTDLLDIDYLKLTLSGTGNISLDVRGLEVDVEISGSGKVCLNGNAASSKIEISGSGHVDAENLKTFSSRIFISGHGSTSVCSDDLTIEISGSGKVRYHENPSHLDVNITGSGSVKKI